MRRERDEGDYASGEKGGGVVGRGGCSSAYQQAAHRAEGMDAGSALLTHKGVVCSDFHVGQNDKVVTQLMLATN